LDELAGAKNAKGPQFGKYHLHADVYTDMPEKEVKARSNALTAITKLQAHIDAGKPVCFIGLWAYNPPMILEAVKDKGVLNKVKIVAFDENPVTLDGIRDGHIVGTVVQQLHVPHYIVTKDGKPFSTKESKNADGKVELPKLVVEGKTAEFWKADWEQKIGQK
jgi:ribose transport system substrate-binding protein